MTKAVDLFDASDGLLVFKLRVIFTKKLILERNARAKRKAGN